jgi:hypothetical protein
VRRQEFPHHTHEQIAGYLADAGKLVEAVDIPADLVPIAYGKAVELLAAKQIVFEQVAPSPVMLDHLQRHG